MRTQHSLQPMHAARDPHSRPYHCELSWSTDIIHVTPLSTTFHLCQYVSEVCSTRCCGGAEPECLVSRLATQQATKLATNLSGWHARLNPDLPSPATEEHRLKPAASALDSSNMLLGVMHLSIRYLGIIKGYTCPYVDIGDSSQNHSGVCAA